jgi:cytochrome b pre-mRNA-processing protein 3
LVIAHAAVVVLRLRRDPVDAGLAQEFIDAFFKYLDASLREAGVGDLTVPKRMKKLAGGFYGRLKAYEEGLKAAEQSLEAALIRNALGKMGAGFAPALAAHVRAEHARLQNAAVSALADPAFWAAGEG